MIVILFIILAISFSYLLIISLKLETENKKFAKIISLDKKNLKDLRFIIADMNCKIINKDEEIKFLKDTRTALLQNYFKLKLKTERKRDEKGRFVKNDQS